jgi:hypothetical protein
MAAAPANDNFANATVFTGTSVSGSDVDATRESGDPTTIKWPGNSDTTAGDRSVWWKWTPTTSGTVTFATGPNEDPQVFDTQLGVYTGTLGNLTEIASDEDSSDFAHGLSKVTFNATANTTYYIMVNGFESATGSYVLNLTSGGTPPPTSGFSLTVTTTGDGAVTRDPEKTSYDTNEVVTLTATPNGTNTFVGWGGDAAAFGSTNPITITMDGNKTVSAEFTGTAAGGGGGGGHTSMEIIVDGIGKVTPNLSGKDNLVIGRKYHLKAKPGKDQVFAGWSGFTNSDDETLNFIMEEGLSVTATFVPNPFSTVEGDFSGLFSDTNGITEGCSGYFVVKVTDKGKFTIRMSKDGKTLSGSGNLDETGAGTATLRDKTNEVTVQIQTDLNGGSDTITGTVTSPDCVAQLQGDRLVFDSKNPPPTQGKYNIVIERNETVNGNGFATLTIDKKGKVKIKGELADGSKISQTTTVSKDGNIPVYVSLYKKQGSLIGWLNVTGTQVTGTLTWINPGANGFEIDVPVTGSLFDSSVKPPINLVNPVLEIGGAGLVDPILIPVTIDEKGKVSVTGANDNNVSLKVSKTGTVKGSFSTTNQKKTALHGILLQDTNTGAGYFIDGTPGYFELKEQQLE